jgi:maltoporin
MRRRAREFSEQEFQRDTESREQSLLFERRPFTERVEQVLQDFVDIHGYFRAGYGRDDQGGPQVAFQAPGALAKYRLGNEAENYGELTFGKNFYAPDLSGWTDRIDDSPPGPLARCSPPSPFITPIRVACSGGTEFASRKFGVPSETLSLRSP